MQALVIGGTGMLSDLVTWLAEKYQCVSVIGKSWSRMERLIHDSGDLAERIVPISVDYTDREKLLDAVRKNLWRNGPVDLLVAWIRSGYIDSLSAVAEEISGHTNDDWRLFHVRGTLNLSERRTPNLPDHVKYREVVLGFKIEEDGSRWLTDDEIWKGVRDAIVNDDTFSVVGTIEPLDSMP